LVTYVTDRLREFSTWRRIAAIAATAGAVIAPGQLDATCKLFVAALGAVAVIAPNKRTA